MTLRNVCSDALAGSGRRLCSAITGAVLVFGALTSGAHAQSLSTAVSNNGTGGVFMNLTPSGASLNLVSFASQFAGATGTAVTVEVWTRPGTYVGFTTASTGWTLTQTVSGTSAGTTTTSAPIALTTPINLPGAGATTAVYLQGINTNSALRYSGTGTTAVTTYSNADITLFSDIARTGTVAFAGTQFTPRCFSGTITYQPANPNAIGACCASSGSCQEIAFSACQSSGGVFRGEAVLCTPTPCPQPGACCDGNGACTVGLMNACAAGSVFAGESTTCSGPNNTCPNANVGACCGNTTGTCTFVASAAACATGNSFQGAGSTCGPTNPCTAQLGACCSSTGVCTQTLAAGCTGTTQTFTAAGMACTPTNPCTALLRACCSGTGTCSLTTMVGCTGTSQFQAAATSCTPTNPCTALLGACCSSTAGTCTQTTNTGCASPSVFQSIGATCSPSNPCGGACCNTTTGACTTVLNLAACNAGAGPFTANGVCTPNPCGGACCNTATAACTTTVNAAACTVGGFTAGGVCTPSPCPTPGDVCTAPIMISSSTFNSGAIQVFTATDDTNVNPSCDSATNTLGAKQGVWFQYTPASNQGVLMSETGTQDVVLTVWTGANCSSLTQLVCSDTEASIPVGLSGGTTYWFMVSKFSNVAYAAGTSITFTLAPSTTVIACCNQSTGACAFSSTTCATGTVNNLTGVCTPTSCPASATCCNDTSGACTTIFGGLCPTGTTLTGTGNSCAAGSNPCPPTQACCTGTSCSVTLASGTCPAGSISAGAGSSCTPSPCTAADECQTTTLVANVGANPSNSSGATTSVTLTPASCPSGLTGSGGSNDIFFRFTAPATASYKLDTCGTAGYDTVLSIHSGCPTSDSNLLMCNDDFTSGSTCVDNSTPAGLRSVISSVSLTSGQLYYIRVAGYGATGGATGAFTLNIGVGATGTCCVGSTCTLTDAASCTGGGTFTGGNSCTANPCPSSGVCCRGSTCSTTVTSAAACTASLIPMQTAGADFRAGTACNPTPTSNSPCCFGDYNKVGGITVNDIFDFLADWFAGSPYANTGGNGSGGSLNVQNIFDFLTAWFAGGCQP